jgi:hypothetical protein
MPVVDLPRDVPVDDVPGEPETEGAPMEPAEEPPAAPPPAPPAPAAKAQLPDAANAAANISVVIFMDILLCLWTKDKTRRGGTFRPSGKRPPDGIINRNGGVRGDRRLSFVVKLIFCVKKLFCRKGAHAPPTLDFGQRYFRSRSEFPYFWE